LGRQSDAKQLAPAKKKRPGLMGRIKRVVAPSASGKSSVPAVIPRPETPSIPAAPGTSRDPVDELLEPSDAPAKPQRPSCWWC
jgi:hypothetical protein